MAEINPGVGIGVSVPNLHMFVAGALHLACAFPFCRVLYLAERNIR